VRVLIAGKKSSLRHALTRLLNSRPGYEVVGTVSSKEKLFARIDTQSPDLLLLDEDMATALIEEVIKPIQLVDLCPNIIVLGVRTAKKEAYLDAGVMSFVNKNDPPKSLLTAVEQSRSWSNDV